MKALIVIWFILVCLALSGTNPNVIEYRGHGATMGVRG